MAGDRKRARLALRRAHVRARRSIEGAVRMRTDEQVIAEALVRQVLRLVQAELREVETVTLRQLLRLQLHACELASDELDRRLGL